MIRELIATATFGLEAVVRREVEALGYNVIRTEDGKVTYEADERGIVRSNLWLRCADRVLLKIDEFKAEDFEELFQRVGGIAWEEMIPLDGRFVVTCTTVKSKLHNAPACQRTVKKAIALRLQEFYCVEQMPETGAEYTIKITLLKDRVTLTVDTSGTGLHKRGYRVADVAAPLKETLAAALVQLSFWRRGRILIDPCCGGATIPIEAAMIAGNIAPGLGRSFAAERWDIIDGSIWEEERRNAEKSRIGTVGCDGRNSWTDKSAARGDGSISQTDKSAARGDGSISQTDKSAARGRVDQSRARILASDVDPRAMEAAKANAAAAGVEDMIEFKQVSIKDFTSSKAYSRIAEQKGVVIVTNLPYGQRIGDDENILDIYSCLRSILEAEPTWSLFAITSDKRIEKCIGRPADRRRKLYNGNIETTYFQFHGDKFSL